MAAVYIVIPVLNEEENIPTLANHLLALQKTLPKSLSIQYLFVDDGSTDNTVNAVNDALPKSKTHVISHVTNLGPGAAFASAFEYVAKDLKDDDWVLTMEGDNTSSCDIIAQMFTRQKEGYDVILASPYMYGGTICNTSWWRQLLSFFANFFLKEILGLRGIFTMSSFFRLHRGSFVRHMQGLYGARLMESKGFEGVTELLMKMVFCEVKLSEVPLILDTSKRKGKSKMRVFKTAFSLIMLLRHRRRWQRMANPMV